MGQRTKEDAYAFRREDNGQIVYVSWDRMMENIHGVLTLEDGVQARRVDNASTVKRASKDGGPPKPIISDSLGFPERQLEEMEAHRKLNGFSGVEFVQDPTCPQFYQTKISSPGEWNRYVKSRGFYDKNGMNGSGAMVTPEQIEQARARVSK